MIKYNSLLPPNAEGVTVEMESPCHREEDAARMHATISDVIPLPFRDRIDRDAQPEAINSRIVGVQSIYEGLTLTRALARFPPWEEERNQRATRI